MSLAYLSHMRAHDLAQFGLHYCQQVPSNCWHCTRSLVTRWFRLDAFSIEDSRYKTEYYNFPPTARV